jgi:DNA-binding MarR family transcriptional regulator
MKHKPPQAGTRDQTRWRSRTRLTSAEDTLGFFLWQVTHAWQRSVDAALSQYDMTHLQLVLLAALAKHLESQEEVTQVQLARFCAFEVTLVSQVLRKLEAKGLIKRSPALSDPRAKRIELTEKGEDTLVQLMPVLEQAHDNFFAPLGADHASFSQGLILLWNAQNSSEPQNTIAES